MLNIISYRLYQVDSLDQVQIILINLMFVPVNLQGESVVHSCPVAAAVRKEAAAAASSIQHPQPLRSLAEPLSSSSIQPLNFSNPLSSCAGRSNGGFKDSSLYQEPRVDPLIIIIRIKCSSNSGRIIHVEIVSPDRDKLCQFQQC